MRRSQHCTDARSSGLSRATFEQDETVLAAVERWLSRISEAAVKLDSLAEATAPSPAWHNIRGLGNRLRHGYDSITVDTIWGIVTTHLDPLEAACRQALTKLPPDPP